MQVALVRLVGSVLQLVLSIVLAHLAGTAVLGRFLVFVAIVNLCAAIGAGVPNLMLRHASGGGAGSPPQVGWLWRHGFELALVCLLAAVAFGSGGDLLLRDVAVAVAGLLAQRISSAVLKAGGRPDLGVLLDTASHPFVVLVTALVLHAATGLVTLEALRLSYIAAIWGATVLAVVGTARGRNSIGTAWSAPWRTPWSMYAEILAVSLGAVANVVTSNAPLALAPLFLSAEETGQLGLALRVAGFATTILVSLSAYFGPAFARARTAGELRELRRRSQFACVAFYAPVLLGVLLFPASWLEHVSADLGPVKGLVVLLSLGFSVNAATGLAPTLLLMRGWSTAFSLTSTVTAALTVVALVVGGSLAGSAGMAVGSSGVMAVTSAWIFLVSSRRLDGMAEEGAVAPVARSPAAPRAAEAQ
ncbi:lipopolysaccharide biosynthesis protein [Blastococcus sp. SYSU D00695]